MALSERFGSRLALKWPRALSWVSSIRGVRVARRERRD